MLGHLTDDSPFMDDADPIGQGEHLLEFGGDEQDAHSVVGGLAQTKRLTIKGGLTPNANVAAQAGAMDPAHPIRIIVENGHVILEGVVNSEVDRTVAGMKVSGLNGVFSMENKLAVKKG